MNEELQLITESILDELEKSNKNLRFGILFKDFALQSLDDEVAVFSTPSNLRQKILVSKYKDIIKNALFEATGIEFEIQIISTETNQEIEEPTPIPQPSEQDRKEADEREKQIKMFLESDKESSSASVLSEYTFDNFIEGDSNKFSRAACLAVAM